MSDGCLVNVTGKLGDREFDAGLAIDEFGRAGACAPILKSIVEGRTIDQIREAFKQNGWKARKVAILTGPQMRER
jgi:hypothetical protein